MEAHQLVDYMLKEALEQQASDIYWLPQKDSYSIRFRVNGAQHVVRDVPHELGVQCVSRIKVMAHLLTYRTQVAQDGVISESAALGQAEGRVAVMPTIYGERITIRLLDRQYAPLYLEDLQFQDDTVIAIRQMLQKSSGMIVLTGPTGCGKTTTIYAMIRELLRKSQDPASIISIEDPVECRIDGITQVSLSKSSEEWNYPAALKSALRQDVKTLIIGEMRDREIVKVALEAALTGHRVITTFHAGDIASVYARMLHQGFEPFLIAAAVIGVVSQRLLLSPDHDRQVPVVATLTGDDWWQEVIASKPDICELRKQLKQKPLADLKCVAQEMVTAGLLLKEEAMLI